VIHCPARRGLPRAGRQFEDQTHQRTLRESPLKVPGNPRGKGSVLRHKRIQRGPQGCRQVVHPATAKIVGRTGHIAHAGGQRLQLSIPFKAGHGRIGQQIGKLVWILRLDRVVVDLAEKARPMSIRNEVGPVDIAPVLVAVDPPAHFRRQFGIRKGRQIDGRQFLGLTNHGRNQVTLDFRLQLSQVFVTAPQTEIPAPLVILGRRRGRDRPSLQHGDLAVYNGPLHVLRAAEQGFDPAGKRRHNFNRV